MTKNKPIIYITAAVVFVLLIIFCGLLIIHGSTHKPTEQQHMANIYNYVADRMSAVPEINPEFVVNIVTREQLLLLYVGYHAYHYAELVKMVGVEAVEANIANAGNVKGFYLHGNKSVYITALGTCEKDSYLAHEMCHYVQGKRRESLSITHKITAFVVSTDEAECYNIQSLYKHKCLGEEN